MEAKIAALEEEINILKGEIKSILQEVRTAVLASENPFTGNGSARQARPGGQLEPEVSPELRVVPLSSPPAPQVIAIPAVPLPGASEPDNDPSPSVGSSADDEAPLFLERDARLGAASRFSRTSLVDERPLDRGRWDPRNEADERSKPGYSPHSTTREGVLAFSSRESGPDFASDDNEAVDRPRLAVPTIAGLMVWVEETRARLDDGRLRIVLSLARYGGVIDEELEEVLMSVSSLIDQTPPARASVNDCLVSLRQLDAILKDEAMDEINVARRRRSRRGKRNRDKEVPASKRQ
jgi:hypothetical protein